MKRMWRLAFLTLALVLAVRAAGAADPQPPVVAVAPAAPPVKEEELQRVVRVVADEFPWVKARREAGKTGAQPVPPPKAAPPAAGGDAGGAMPDMSSGEIVIREYGDFSAVNFPSVPGGLPDKQLLTLTKDVTVEPLSPRSVLRAKKFKITRDLKTGTTDLIEAFNSVEMFMPEQKGKGEMLHYETKFGPDGEILKDLFILEGNRAEGIRAFLWLGTDPDPEKNDKVEADKFINDRRLNIFHALGTPAAVVTMAGPPPATPDATPAKPGAPAAPAKPGASSAPKGPPAPAKPPAASAAASGGPGGMMPNMSGLTSGGLSRLQCDGELIYEGASGRLTLMRNAVIQKEGQPAVPGAAAPGSAAPGSPAPASAAPGATVGASSGIKLTSDEAHLLMDVPPPGQPDANAGMFGGELKTIECIGRVEMKTVTHTVLCDRCTIDMVHSIVYMEMKDPKENVRIFIIDDTGGRAMTSRKSFTYNMSTSDMQSPFGMKTEELPVTIPTNRPAAPVHSK